MANIIDSFRDKVGNLIYPKTLTKAVYEEGTNKRLDTTLEENKTDILTLQTQNGSEVLTTTAQTLSGAINEIKEQNNDLGAEVDTHATDITNRLKKDGDRTSKYLGINNFFSGICFTEIGSETQIKIKTKIRLAEPLMFEIKYGGFNKAQIIYLTFDSNVGGFSYAKAKSIGTSPPVITLAKENEYIVIHIVTGSTGFYSPFYANVISRYPNQIIEPENWTAVKEAILPEATSVTVVPYVD